MRFRNWYWLILLLSLKAQAQDLEPRSYLNIPVDQTFFSAIYLYSTGDVYTSSDLPIDDFQLTTTTWGGQFARTFELDDKLAKFDVLFATACGDGEAIFRGEFRTKKFCGMADSKVKFNYNFYGAPALSPKQFLTKESQAVVGFTVQVTVPNGHYKKDEIFNIGTNRWAIETEIGGSFPIGNFEIDAAISGIFFEDNDEYFGDNVYSQDPVYNFQVHFIYDIGPAHWIGLDLNYFDGGDGYLNGEPFGIKKGNYRGGVSYRYSFNAHNSIKLIINKGITTRLGNDTDAATISWTYRL